MQSLLVMRGEKSDGQTVRPIRVVIADQHRLFLEALTLRFQHEPDLIVVESTASARAAEAAIERLTPDVAVVNVHLDDGDGIELTRWVRATSPGTAVVMLHTDADASAATAALRAGALAFITQDAPSADVIRAVRGVAAGETWVHPHLLTSVVRELDGSARTRNEYADRLACLTQRELDVLAHLVAGLDRQQVAAALLMSVNTVRTHMKHIFSKLNVHSSLEAVRLARLAGFPSAKVASAVLGRPDIFRRRGDHERRG